MEGDAMANDLKLSICRDVGHGSNQVVKRKITWQDQVALRVQAGSLAYEGEKDMP